MAEVAKLIVALRGRTNAAAMTMGEVVAAYPEVSFHDPWGRLYLYRRVSALEFELRSLGEDGERGGSDDDEDISIVFHDPPR